MKFILASKTIWFNVVMTLVDIATFVQDIVAEVFPPNWQPVVKTIVVLIHGIGNIVLRIWFNQTPLSFRLGKKQD